MKQINIKKGDNIIEEGEPSGSAYILESGRMEVSKTCANGEKRVMAILEEKAFIGEMGLIDGLPRSTTVTALENCTVSEFTLEMFNSLAKRNPRALMPFLRILASRLRSTLKIIEED